MWNYHMEASASWNCTIPWLDDGPSTGGCRFWSRPNQLSRRRYVRPHCHAHAHDDAGHMGFDPSFVHWVGKIYCRSLSSIWNWIQNNWMTKPTTWELIFSWKIPGLGPASISLICWAKKYSFFWSSDCWVMLIQVGCGRVKEKCSMSINGRRDRECHHRVWHLSLVKKWAKLWDVVAIIFFEGLNNFSSNRFKTAFITHKCFNFTNCRFKQNSGKCFNR